MAELLNNNLPELEVSQEDLAKQKEIKWTVLQTKKALDSPDINPFYKKNGEKYLYDLDTVKTYLGRLLIRKDHELKAVNTAAWIMAVQIGLKALKYDIKVIDGLLATKGHFSDSETAKVVAKFQADNKLTVTGVPYVTTIRKLLEKLGGAVSGAASESNVNNQNVTDEASFDADPKVKGHKDKKGVPELFPNPLTFEQSAITSEVVQAWKKQAENYFKDKNPKEYKSFSSPELAN